MSLEGIDVSYAQTHTPSLVGKAFAFAQATVGTKVDTNYAYHTANFRKAGIVAGAYHFAVQSSVVSVAAQVSAFLNTASGSDLLALDVEGAHPMSATDAQAFINAVRAKGRKCGLYASRSGYPISISCDFRWIADYTGTVPNISWQFWQYTSQGTASGLDLDKFNGDLAALHALVGGHQPVIVPTDQPTELVDLVAPTGGVAATAYAEDFKTILGTVGPTVNVKAYGLVRPRSIGAALTPIVGPSGTAWVGKVGWVGVDWVKNRRLINAGTSTKVTVIGQNLTVTQA